MPIWQKLRSNEKERLDGFVVWGYLIAIIVIGGLGVHLINLLLTPTRLPETTGTVISVAMLKDDRGTTNEMWYTPEVRFEFTVGDQLIQGSRVSPSAQEYPTREEAERILARFRPGDTITIRYDPNNPSRAYLLRSTFPFPIYAILLLAWAWFVRHLYFVYFWFRRELRSYRPIAREIGWYELVPESVTQGRRTVAIVQIVAFYTGLIACVWHFEQNSGTWGGFGVAILIIFSLYGLVLGRDLFRRYKFALNLTTVSVMTNQQVFVRGSHLLVRIRMRVLDEDPIAFALSLHGVHQEENSMSNGPTHIMVGSTKMLGRKTAPRPDRQSREIATELAVTIPQDLEPSRESFFSVQQKWWLLMEIEFPMDEKIYERFPVQVR